MKLRPLFAICGRSCTVGVNPSAIVPPFLLPSLPRSAAKERVCDSPSWIHDSSTFCPFVAASMLEGYSLRSTDESDTGALSTGAPLRSKRMTDGKRCGETIAGAATTYVAPVQTMLCRLWNDP